MPRSVRNNSASSSHYRGDMSVVGYVVAAGSLLLVLPVLPIIAVVLLVDWILNDEGTTRSGEGTTEDSEVPPPQEHEHEQSTPHTA